MVEGTAPFSLVPMGDRMNYDYSQERSLTTWRNSEEFVAHLLYTRVGFLWMGRPNTHTLLFAPGVHLLGWFHRNCKPGFGPWLTRILYCYADGASDCISHASIQGADDVAAFSSLEVGSPHFAPPRPEAVCHPSSKIILERVLKSDHGVAHSRYWGYSVGTDRPKHVRTFGFGWGGLK
jgi:hypothetical protein